MTRILHAAFQKNEESGISHQMAWEQIAAEELGLLWKSQLVRPEMLVAKGIGLKKKKILNWRKYYANFLLEQKNDFDVLLLRHTAANRYEANLIKSLGKPVFLVFHTKDIPEIKSGSGLKKYASMLIEQFAATKALNYCTGIIGVTNEIVQYNQSRSPAGKPSFVYPNGIMIEKVIPLLDSRPDNSNVEVAFLASAFAPWHGFELLVDSLEASSLDITIHIIGQLNKQQLAMAKGEPRLKIHGRLAKDEISSVFDRCCVGLASFGMGKLA